MPTMLYYLKNYVILFIIKLCKKFHIDGNYSSIMTSQKKKENHLIKKIICEHSAHVH